SQQEYEGESGQEQRTNNTAQCERTTAAELIGPQDETEPIGFEQVASFGQRHMWWRSWKRTAFVGGLFVAVFLAYQLRLIYFTRVQGNQAASSINVGGNRDKVV